MRILCLGGGPAGLYFALLMKRQNPAHPITVIERNRPFDTFGWGVVLSDQTLANPHAADAASAQLIGDAFNHWDDVEVFFKGRSVRSGGHGFCGIGRKKLLTILQERCLALGVARVFETDVQDDQALAAQFQADRVIAGDGLNSCIRGRYAATFKPDVELRASRFVWLGTHKTFDAFTEPERARRCLPGSDGEKFPGDDLRGSRGFDGAARALKLRSRPFCQTRTLRGRRGRVDEAWHCCRFPAGRSQPLVCHPQPGSSGQR